MSYPLSYPVGPWRDLYRGTNTCPICNTEECACVGPNEEPVVPVDIPQHREESSRG